MYNADPDQIIPPVPTWPSNRPPHGTVGPLEEFIRLLARILGLDAVLRIPAAYRLVENFFALDARVF